MYHITQFCKRVKKQIQKYLAFTASQKLPVARTVELALKVIWYLQGYTFSRIASNSLDRPEPRKNKIEHFDSLPPRLPSLLNHLAFIHDRLLHPNKGEQAPNHSSGDATRRGAHGSGECGRSTRIAVVLVWGTAKSRYDSWLARFAASRAQCVLLLEDGQQLPSWR